MNIPFCKYHSVYSLFMSSMITKNDKQCKQKRTLNPFNGIFNLFLKKFALLLILTINIVSSIFSLASLRFFGYIYSVKIKISTGVTNGKNM